MPDQNRVSQVSLRNFFVLTTIGHVVFAVPVLIILVLLQYLSPASAVLLFTAFSVVGIPLSAGIGYLIARGSALGLDMNDSRRSMVKVVAGILPGQMYGALFGGALGYNLWQPVGGIIGTIIFFIIGSIAGWRSAGYISNNRL
ncbi:MAG: hypothetical protein MUC85_12505 [Anaerolineales bacterium]|jgi:hypothetical protein|nr:hypothetical protein [Anaerolineales bacterium]